MAPSCSVGKESPLLCSERDKVPAGPGLRLGVGVRGHSCSACKPTAFILMASDRSALSENHSSQLFPPFPPFRKKGSLRCKYRSQRPSHMLISWLQLSYCACIPGGSGGVQVGRGQPDGLFSQQALCMPARRLSQASTDTCLAILPCHLQAFGCY